MKYLSLFEDFENDPILSAIKEIRGLGYPNPLNGREVVIDDVILLEVSKFDNAIWISSIQSFEQGHATRIMRKIFEIADKHNVSIKLSPEPYGKKGLKKKDLVAWYKRLGFEPSTQGNMKRLPKPISSSSDLTINDESITEADHTAVYEGMAPINERVVILSCDETIPVDKIGLVVGKLGIIQEKQDLLGMITVEFPEDLTKDQIEERIQKLSKITGVKEIFNDIFCKLY